MNKSEAKTLKIGDTVYYCGKVPGKVVSVHAGACINVHWSDGEKSATHPADCELWTRKPVQL